MIYLASDHAGFELKNNIIKFLKDNGIDCKDMWPYNYDALDDYPDFIIPCAEKVAENPENLWIVFWGSWQWEAIAANKVKNIRAALYYGWNLDIVKLSKVHNNANILSIWARFVNLEEAKKAIMLWLETNFLNEERHVRRINKIYDYENK